jgi:hypothetical protein
MKVTDARRDLSSSLRRARGFGWFTLALLGGCALPTLLVIAASRASARR